MQSTHTMSSNPTRNPSCPNTAGIFHSSCNNGRGSIFCNDGDGRGNGCRIEHLYSGGPAERIFCGDTASHGSTERHRHTSGALLRNEEANLLERIAYM